MWLNVIVDAVALNEEVPVTDTVPASVMAPVLTTARFPVTVEFPRLKAPVADKETFLPVSRTSPVKVLAVFFRVRSLTPASIVVVPVT